MRKTNKYRLKKNNDYSSCFYIRLLKIANEEINKKIAKKENEIYDILYRNLMSVLSKNNFDTSIIKNKNHSSFNAIYHIHFTENYSIDEIKNNEINIMSEISNIWNNVPPKSRDDILLLYKAEINKKNYYIKKIDSLIKKISRNDVENNHDIENNNDILFLENSIRSSINSKNEYLSNSAFELEYHGILAGKKR